MSSIVIGESQISGFQPSAVGADIALTGMTVTLGSPNVTGTNFLPQSVVGLGGFKITFSTGVTYTVATVTSRSALTLTTNYGESTATVTGTLRKFVHLRVYVMTPFVPSGETFVAQSGAPGSTAWFRRYGVSIISDGAQNVAHVPQITLPATTDSSVPAARYFAALYTQGGALIQAFPGCVDEWQLSHLTTPTSWAQICAFNSPSPPRPPLNPESFYTKQQIDARFPSGLANQLIYYKNTGNVLKPLTLDAAFTISSDTLFLAGPSGVNRVQENGVDLPQRQKINFGAGLLATDDVGNARTNVDVDSKIWFVVDWFIADPSTYPVQSFNLAQKVRMPGNAGDFITTAAVLSYATGTASGSFVVQIQVHSPNAQGAPTIIGTITINPGSVGGEAVFTMANQDIAGKYVYIILDSRTSPLQRDVSIALHGEQKLH